MKTMFRKNRTVRLATLFLALSAMIGMPSNASLASAPWKVSSVPLAGVNGGSNNVAFAFDRYVLVAPYAPLNPIDENSDLKQLDNHFVYLIDTKKPSDGMLPISIEGFDPSGNDSKTVFYPTRILFDPIGRIVYVRGTRFERQEAGYKGIEVIAYLHLNLDDNNKPIVTSKAVVFDIKGAGTDENSSDAPMDFALGQKGNLLVFTNGASIFTYNVDEGYVYKVNIVPAREFSEGSRITYLDVDEATDIVTVYWNSKAIGKDGSVKISSELSFYHLDSDGILPLMKRVNSDQFPENAAMIAGSGVAITATGDKPEPEFAYFVTSDGSLCQVDLSSDGTAASVKQLFVFDELANGGLEDASPRTVKFDSLKHVIGIVKQGFTAQIRRPATGRPGRPGNLLRSLNTFTPIEPPAFALVKLSKRNKVISSNVFVNDFSAEQGLTNFVAGRDGQWMVSTHSGNLYTVANTEDPQQANLQLMTQLGPRTDQIAFCSSRLSVVAVNSFEPDESGNQITSPGSVVIAKMNDVSAQVASATFSIASAKPHGVIASKVRPDLSIRRPCNDRRLN